MNKPNQSIIYRGWDCHAYTADLLKVLQTDEKLNFKGPIERSVFNTTVSQITQFLNTFPPPQPRQARIALNKMVARFNNQIGGYLDPDLANQNVAKILVETWNLVSSLQEQSTKMLFFETLKDIGNTCIQGDSHRLLLLYIALCDK